MEATFEFSSELDRIKLHLLGELSPMGMGGLFSNVTEVSTSESQSHTSSSSSSSLSYRTSSLDSNDLSSNSSMAFEDLFGSNGLFDFTFPTDFPEFEVKPEIIDLSTPKPLDSTNGYSESEPGPKPTVPKTLTEPNRKPSLKISLPSKSTTEWIRFGNPDQPQPEPSVSAVPVLAAQNNNTILFYPESFTPILFIFLLLPNTSQPKPTSTLFTTRACRFPLISSQPFSLCSMAETLSPSILPILLLARLRQSHQLKFVNMYRQYVSRRRRKRHYSGCGFACGIQALLPLISILVVAGLLISPKGTWNGRITKDLLVVSSLFLSILVKPSFHSWRQ